MTLDLPTLRNLVETRSILRLTARLQPQGAGGCVQPPTYSEGQHIFRKAWVDGEERDAVLLDSVQSQANRIEEAILQAVDDGVLAYPDIRVEIDRSEGPPEEYSVLQLSHRIFDAVLRQTLLDGEPFPKTAIGKAIYSARLESAGPIYTHAPVSLVLGAWDSHGGGGPLSLKLPRLVSSEIIGVDARPARRGAVKFDPMDIRKGAGPLYASPDPDLRFSLEKPAGSKAKKKNPSDYGFGNVPTLEDRGAVIRYALQTTTVSLTAARRISFQDVETEERRARDQAGRTALIALALHGMALQWRTGHFLRSGCELVPETWPSLEVIGRSLEETETLPFDLDATEGLLQAALEEAAKHGLRWREEVLHLTANEVLRTLVEQSRAVAAEELVAE